MEAEEVQQLIILGMVILPHKLPLVDGLALAPQVVAVGVMVMVVVEVAGLLQEELDSPEMEMEDGLAAVVSLNPLLMVEPDNLNIKVAVVEVLVPSEEVQEVMVVVVPAAVIPAAAAAVLLRAAGVPRYRS